DIADGDRDVQLTIRVSSSADVDFADLPLRSVVVRNLDDDTVGADLSLSGPGELIEGESTSLQLTLRSQPLAAVQFSLLARVEPAQWNQLVPVRLDTFDNGVFNQRRTVAIHVADIESSDPAYAALAIEPVMIELEDRVPVGVVAQPIPGPGRTALWLLAIGLM